MKTLWYGGTIYTMEQEGEKVEALLVEDGKITTIGTEHELRQIADSEIDLNGSVLYPGFVDSHMHMIGHGENLGRLDLSDVTSSEEMKARLIEAVAIHPSGEWFIGEGWNENNFVDKKIFSRYELDEISQSPMLLKRICRHAMIVNSKALELAGITKDTPDPDGGVIIRDEHGVPTGQLMDEAMELVNRVLPDYTEEYLVRSLERAVDDLVARGITGAHTEDMGYYGHYSKPLSAFKKVIGKHRKFRAHLLRHHTVFEEMVKDGASYDEPWIEPGPMKIFADGSLGGRTALLSKPYHDDPSTKGVAIHADEELHRLVAIARKHGEAVAIHMIGDLAVEKALDAIEAYPAPEGKRDRLIHVCILREELVERMEKLPVELDLQPSFVTSDFPWAAERLGPDRLNWAYAWKKLLERGLLCSGGSDSPIEEVDPLLGMYAAVTRRLPGETHEGYLPEEKLSRFEAIRLYTVGSAEAICKEDSRGLVKEGFDADFTILDRDLFEGEPETFVEAQVKMTVIDGDVVYKK